MSSNKIINASILLDDIKDEFCFKGKKGKYLNIVLRETPDDQYGNDYMVTQGVPKNQRVSASGEKVMGPILGNGKNFFFEDRSEPSSQASAPSTPAPADDIDEDVPF
jgi:hypothetical protein